jgi:hypothetical protein
MLKTAMLTLGLTALGAGALAAEMPKYDRKIERAAMERVAAKVGGLRETLDVEIKVALADVAALPIELDLAPTATVLARHGEPQQSEPVEIKNFRIIAGEYDR